MSFIHWFKRHDNPSRVVVYHYEEATILVYKNINLVFIYERVEILLVKEIERQRDKTDWLRLMENCYLWYHIFTHVVILYSEPHLVLPWGSWSGWFLNAKPLGPLPRTVYKAASALTACFFWLTVSSIGIEIVYLYDVHNTPAFLFRFVIYFGCFLCLHRSTYNLRKL